MEMGRACEGSVAMRWVEEHGDSLCMQGFCSNGIGGRNMERRRVCKGSLAALSLASFRPVVFVLNHLEVVNLDVSESGEIPKY